MMNRQKLHLLTDRATGYALKFWQRDFLGSGNLKDFERYSWKELADLAVEYGFDPTHPGFVTRWVPEKTRKELGI